MNRILRLNDGTEYPLKYCGEDNGVLWFEIETDMPTACAAFSDREKLVKITDTYDGQEDLRSVEWDGYTEMIYISNIGTGDYIRIGLKKGAGE